MAPDLTKALIAHPANGQEGFTRVFQAANLPHTFESFFGDWLIANYVDDPFALGLDKVYGYEGFEHKPPQIAATHTTFPVAQQEATVANYAVDYILLDDANGSSANGLTFSFQGQAQTGLASTRPASGTHAWWSNRSDEMDTRLTRQFDLTSLSPGSDVELTAQMWWDIEIGYDYGYALASIDGQKWQILPGEHTTTENPSGASFGAAYNGRSGEDGSWVTERYDLSEYAGESIWVRFEKVTDGAVNMPGWFVDDVQIPVIGYASDFENGPDGWQSEGWLLTDNVLPQGWLLQVFTLRDNTLEQVHRNFCGGRW